jgi:hypothetical protein
VRLTAFLQTGNRQNDSRATLLESIARHISQNNTDFVSLAQRSETVTAQAGVTKLLQDPVFEAAYGEMPDDDKLEFPEIRSEFRKGRVRQHMADRVVETVRRKRRQAGGPLPKRRVRARGAAAPTAPTDAPVPEVAAPRSAVAEPNAAAPVDPASPAANAASDASSNALMPPCPVLPAADVPGDAPAPEVAAQPAAVAGPVIAALVGQADNARPGPPAERVARGQPWAKGRFILARTHRAGELHAVTVTCLLHGSENARCNKNLNMGSTFSEAEATRRIKEWCIRGLDIPAADGAREIHMYGRGKPRAYSDAELRSEAELDALGNA